MSDERARARAREAALTDDPAVRAAELVERLRRDMPCSLCSGTGRTTPRSGSRKGDPRYTETCACTRDGLKARVQLAAYCRDPGAALALGVELVTANSEYYAVNDRFVSSPSNLEAWCHGLTRWGTRVRMRAALPAADLCWEKLYAPLICTTAMLHPPVREVANAMAVAREVLEEPGSTPETRLAQCDRVWNAHQALEGFPRGTKSAWAACRVAAPAMPIHRVFSSATPIDVIASSLSQTLDPLVIGLADACDALADHGFDEAAVMRHVRQALIAWALKP